MAIRLIAFIFLISFAFSSSLEARNNISSYIAFIKKKHLVSIFNKKTGGIYQLNGNKALVSTKRQYPRFLAFQQKRRLECLEAKKRKENAVRKKRLVAHGLKNRHVRVFQQNRHKKILFARKKQVRNFALKKRQAKPIVAKASIQQLLKSNALDLRTSLMLKPSLTVSPTLDTPKLDTKASNTHLSGLNSVAIENARVVGLDQLYANGYYGDGVTVAVIELSGEWELLRKVADGKAGNLPKVKRDAYKRNFLPAIGGPDLDPEAKNDRIRFQTRNNPYHGSAVASIILDFTSHAKVLPVSTYGIDVSTQYELGDALMTLSQRPEVSVINVSGGEFLYYMRGHERGSNPDGTPKLLWNHSFPEKYLEAFRAVADAGKVIVLGAGNAGEEILDEDVLQEGEKERKFFRERLVAYLAKNLDEETLKSVIFAGSIDPTTREASYYSNKAGVVPEVQDRFLFAPGRHQDSYSSQISEGTSNVAPLICSVLAGLISKPGVTARRAVQALLDSAEPRSDRRTYGRGVIRADEALRLLEENE